MTVKTRLVRPSRADVLYWLGGFVAHASSDSLNAMRSPAHELTLSAWLLQGLRHQHGEHGLVVLELEGDHKAR